MDVTCSRCETGWWLLKCSRASEAGAGVDPRVLARKGQSDRVRVPRIGRHMHQSSPVYTNKCRPNRYHVQRLATVTEGNRGPTFALRRSILEFCLGWAALFEVCEGKPSTPPLATQGSSWWYLKVNSSETLSIFGDKCPRNGSKNEEMAPRTKTGYPHIGPFVGIRSRQHSSYCIA
jgi:hypothetical protein